MPSLTIPRRHPMVLLVDGAAIRVSVKRLTADEAGAFRRAWAAILDPPSKRTVLVRKDGEELATRPVDHALVTSAQQALQTLIGDDPARDQAAGPIALALLAVPRDRTYEVPDAEIAERRYRELSESARAAYDAARECEVDAERAFYLSVIPDYLAIDAGQIAVEEVNGTTTPVTTGQQFVEVYGARLDLLRAAASVILGANTLDDTAKKAYGSLFGSIDGSAVSDPASGPRPDGAALPAGRAGSVKSDRVTASTAAGPSGVTVN